MPRQKNVDFIICDHHKPGDEIPKAFAVLNPKRVDCARTLTKNYAVVVWALN
jgi:single-stranded DNA-specific DHH superfamily exonuclease